MNTCIKCGCEDAYPSLPPCPTPEGCPNPQPCAEFFDAQCVRFSLPNIVCGLDTVVFQDDTVAEALDNIVSYFCQRLVTLTNYINAQLLIVNNRLTAIEGAITNIEGDISDIRTDITNIEGDITDIQNDITTIQGDITTLETTVSGLEACCDTIGGLVQSVTGLNTDNTDPLNPIVKISVDGTTITGLGTPASPLVATSTPYSLPTASPTILGGIKIGTGLSIDGLGVVSTTSINLQKEITATYALEDADNDYTIFINNGATPITISLGSITIPNFSVGFVQEGTGDITFSGVTNPVGLKLKGQGYQAFIERKLSTSTYYLLGNTKV